MASTAILLCAGEGSRIRDLTDDPKCLLNVVGRTIIQHQLDAVVQAGVDRAVIVTGYRSDMLRASVQNLALGIVPEFVENPDYKRLGNSYSLLVGLRATPTDVVVLDGDLVFEPQILCDFLDAETNAFAIGMGKLDDIECAKALCDGDGYLRKLVDKRALTPEELNCFDFVGEAMGIIRLDSNARQRLISESEDFLSDSENQLKNWEFLFTRFLVSERIRAHRVSSRYWLEIDDADDYQRANLLFSQMC